MQDPAGKQDILKDNFPAGPHVRISNGRERSVILHIASVATRGRWRQRLEVAADPFASESCLASCSHDRACQQTLANQSRLASAKVRFSGRRPGPQGASVPLRRCSQWPQRKGSAAGQGPFWHFKRRTPSDGARALCLCRHFLGGQRIQRSHVVRG